MTGVDVVVNLMKWRLLWKSKNKLEDVIEARGESRRLQETGK